MRQSNSDITLVEGLNELNVQMVPIAPPIPEVTVDFDALSILDVEGIPFVSIGTTEPIPPASRDILAGILEEAWARDHSLPPPYSGYQTLKENQALDVWVPWIEQKLDTWAGKDLWTASEDQLSYMFGLNDGSIIYYDPRYPGQEFVTSARLVAQAGPAAASWVAVRGGEPSIPEVILSEPIEMDTLRGISLTIQNHLQGIVSPWAKNYYWFHLWYEPTFDAPMPPPAYRATGIPVPEVGWIGEIPIKELFGAGYYYPGIYDGRIQISLYMDSTDSVIGEFRIKNMARVTGTGTVGG